MKSAFALLSLIALSSLNAFADETFDFTFYGRTSTGGYTMVTCEHARELVEDWMTEFGATKIDIDCMGGIAPPTVSPLDLRVKYQAPVLGTETKVEKVVIRSYFDSNCEFDTRLMQALLRSFPNVKKGASFDSCFNPGSDYTYRLSVTLPK